jgi:hypothetical protein
MRSAKKNVVGQHENIKLGIRRDIKTHLKEGRCEGVDWIHLACGMDHYELL